MLHEVNGIKSMSEVKHDTLDTGTEKPLLSIIIPTRNRHEYAYSAIRSVLNISSDRFELVIQDNSDGNELEIHLKENYSDSRLRYNHTKEPLDVIANFNTALELATGEYFTFIGDDDGVNPEIIDAVIWAKNNNIDALTPANIAGYFWPDLRQKYYGNLNSGKLIIRNFTGEICLKNVEDGMIECAKSSFQNLVYSMGMPKIYYGIVKMECIEKVKERVGTYFPGVSPDMSGAMAVASYVKRFCTIDYPLYLPGSSAKSTAGIGAEKKHWGRLQDQPHLPVGCSDNWPDLVPKFFAVQTVWAQSGWSALKATGREDILQEFNVPLLHAMCATFNPHYFSFTLQSFLKALRVRNKSILFGILQFLHGYVLTWWTRVESKLVQLTSKLKSEKIHNTAGLNTIEDAVNALNFHLRNGGKQFEFFSTKNKFNLNDDNAHCA